MGQVWPWRVTAHGVRLASIRLEWVWLLRPTAHGVSLASTSLDQVCICLDGLPCTIWREHSGSEVLLAELERQNPWVEVIDRETKTITESASKQMIESLEETRKHECASWLNYTMINSGPKVFSIDPRSPDDAYHV
jgi:hypothetical protein